MVKNLESPAVQHRINRTIVSVGDMLMKEQGFYKKQKTEILGWYEIKNNQRGILSLTIGNYAFTYPSAHGLTIVKGLTFDVNNGDGIELKDLFKPGTDYLKVISDIVYKQIKERRYNYWMNLRG